MSLEAAGVTVDFVDGLQGSGFKFQNPNAMVDSQHGNGGGHRPPERMQKSA